jgi:hypothetical protein
MAATIMGDAEIGIGRQEHHLSFLAILVDRVSSD